MEPLGSVECFNPGTGLWEALADMGEPRHGAAGVSIDNTRRYPHNNGGNGGNGGNGTGLYVLGGTGEAGPSACCEVYHVGGWRRLADMPRARTGCCAVAARSEGRDVIVVSGGGDPSLDVYVVTANKWEEWPPMRVGRVGCRLLVVDQALYVVGGTGSGGEQGAGLPTEKLEIADFRKDMTTFSAGEEKWERDAGWPTFHGACEALVGE